MSVETINNSQGIQPQTLPIAAAALDNLAARLNPNGLLLSVIHPDGTLIYHDVHAQLFFQQYVLPLLQRDEPVAGALRGRLQSLGAASPLLITQELPGIIVGAIQHVDRRQVSGIIVLAAKNQTFSLGEDVL